jgi:nucleoside phosphorylase
VVEPTPVAVVLTAIPVEHAAVLEHLHDVREEVHEAGTIFHVGRLENSRWRVALTQTGSGNQQAAALTERAIRYYQPILVMLVGVAGGLHTDLSLGDVVVATEVYAIHGGKEVDAGFRSRPVSWSPQHGHPQRAAVIAASGAWQQLLLEQWRSDA